MIFPRTLGSLVVTIAFALVFPIALPRADGFARNDGQDDRIAYAAGIKESRWHAVTLAVNRLLREV
ncbi:MAG TPA: hypothetical protein VN087_17485 [Verrucomicrobiae bacterium]|jgi:hypothetical protein|nr:hypothetical protein [Verrucomicrobiae bacterium]